MSPLSSASLRELALKAGFDLVGFARAEPIEPRVLEQWLAAGFHADLDWMSGRLAEHLDVRALLEGAKTVMAVACNYWHTDAPSPIARYARGRDYHYTFKDRFRALRREVKRRHPSLKTYASVDANPVMEKVWATRAGLGVIGKNACLITPEYGSWVVLGTFIFEAEVDAYAPGVPEDRCGDCRLCLDCCPTHAIVEPRVVDARACLSYQTIENDGVVPAALRGALKDTAFGCDVCMEVCPLNARPVTAGERFLPRPVSELGLAGLAALSRDDFERLAKGTPLVRAGYDGLRRNAAYALGALKQASARAVLERMSEDASDVVREAAQWALRQLR